MSRKSVEDPSKGPNRINLDFRPATYFWPLKLETHLLSHIKGARRREILKAAIASNQIDQVFELIGDSELPEEAREALGNIHPAFLGGEFLPTREENEVEIARITLESTTSDVTSVYARFEDGMLHYRVVDEYEGETLSGPARCSSDKPLTLGELVEFLNGAWPLMEVLESGVEGGLRDPSSSQSLPSTRRLTHSTGGASGRHTGPMRIEPSACGWPQTRGVGGLGDNIYHLVTEDAVITRTAASRTR